MVPIPRPCFLDECVSLGAFNGQKRWRSEDGKRLYTWDSLHGEIEVYDSDSRLEINEFLGMTVEEYSLWVSDSNALSLIISARHQQLSLQQAVNDNIRYADKLAARAGEARRIARLRRWIEAQPDR